MKWDGRGQIYAINRGESLRHRAKLYEEKTGHTHKCTNAIQYSYICVYSQEIFFCKINYSSR